MYARFTDDARKAMQTANQSANDAGHQYIGTAHILVGILGDESAVASRVLANLGVNVVVFRSEVEQSIKRFQDYPSTEPPTSPPGGKRAVELALELASKLNHKLVGCEHFLLGLLQEDEGMAAQLLKRHGVTIEAATAEVVKLREDGG